MEFPLSPLGGSIHMAPSVLKTAFFFFVLVSFLQVSTSISDPVEVRALQGVKVAAGDVFNKLENWVGEDPCGSKWTGIICNFINGTEHVTELRLLNMNFTGTLAPDLVNLTHLTIINFMWNNMTGSIPSQIGGLSELVLLLLSGNRLTGTLPPELGNLKKLDRMQIDENNVSGPIPPSYANLSKLKHFHMNNNSLNGSIPPELGQLPLVAHFLFDSNNLSGELPSELANISTLLILQLDNNQFSGSIPESYTNMSKQFMKLSLRNCNLSGQIPDFSALSNLTSLELGQNQLTGNIPSNLPSALRTIDWSYNQLDGEIPSILYELRDLELLLLQNNSLDGTVRADLFKHNSFPNADSRFIMDFQNNNFTELTSGPLLDVSNVTLRLSGNPVCDMSSTPSDVCVEFNGVDANITTPPAPKVLPPSCSPDTCDASHNQELDYGLLSLNICQCSFPLVVGYRLKSPSFTFYQAYETDLEKNISAALDLSSNQVNASDFSWEGPRLAVNLKLFPGNETKEFSSSEVVRLYNRFSTFNISISRIFGPYELKSFNIEFPYNESVTLPGGGSRSGLKAGALAGIIIGAAAFAAALVAFAILLIAKRTHKNIYASPRKKAVKHHKSLKIDGVKDFTFKEMKDATNNFETEIGQGGYGRVYKAALADGSVVAIKRAHEGSLQGEKEFSTELHLLSRLHHRNLVSLIGFCDNEGEQMLIYEYMANGTLHDHLKSTSEEPLDFATRLQIALGSAKGILYLHSEADPPILHRDIKASNILLDKNMRAKVADFGISTLAPDEEIGGKGFSYVSTVVKGTPGYVDPEYFLTQKLSDKSDVYSFGVVLLELITGQEPIHKGKNLVREMSLAREAGMEATTVDQRMGSYPPECLEMLLRLAMRCCQDESSDRPSMANVVQELEAICRLMPNSNYRPFFDSPAEEKKANAIKHHPGLAFNNPYVSSDIDGSGLVSGYIPSVTPR